MHSALYLSDDLLFLSMSTLDRQLEIRSNSSFPSVCLETRLDWITACKDMVDGFQLQTFCFWEEKVYYWDPSELKMLVNGGRERIE